MFSCIIAGGGSDHTDIFTCITASSGVAKYPVWPANDDSCYLLVTDIALWLMLMVPLCLSNTHLEQYAIT